MGRIKKNQISFPTYKVAPETVESLKQTAIQCGYIYGDSAAMGEFLDRNNRSRLAQSNYHKDLTDNCSKVIVRDVEQTTQE
jgi:hypothetical protein